MIQTPTSKERLLSNSYRALFIGILFLVCLFNFADRAIFAVLSQPIKIELALSDLQLGLLQGLSFAILYAGLGLPIGRLAERANRVMIISVSCAIWSLATAACGLAHDFYGLMLARIFVGIGEAGFLAPTSSLVADHFPARRRASITSLIMLGTPAGLFAGSIAGGWIAAIADWRTAFIGLGAPGLIIALITYLFLREPTRGLVDNAPKPLTPPPDFRAFLRLLGTNRALLFVLIGGGLAGFGMTSVSQFLAIFLARTHHLSVRDAATLYGSLSALSLALGLLIGSFGTDYLAKRNPRWPAWGASIGLAIAPILYNFAFAAGDIWSASILLIVSGAILLLFYGPTIGMIQNLVEPRIRATSTAMFSILYSLFGAGFGPVFVGFTSDHLAAAYYSDGDFATQCVGGAASRGFASLSPACQQASALGVQQALQLAVCIFFLAAISYVLASRTLARDLYRPENVS